MKREFFMSDEQSKFLWDQMKKAANQRVMYASGGVPLFDDPQEIANCAWKKLGAEMGFLWDSASQGGSDKSFMAEPTAVSKPQQEGD